MGPEQKVYSRQQGKRPNKLRLSLIGLAFALLAGGILWHIGLFNPFELLGLEKAGKKIQLQRFPRKKIPRISIEKEAKAVTSKPKDPVSPPVPSSPPAPTSPHAAKKGADVNTRVIPEKPPSYPYSVHLGSFRTLKRAQKAISINRKKGLSPYWVKVVLSKGAWYRVFTGHFKDHDQAERFRQEHGLTEVTIKKTRYATLIGTYVSSSEIEGKSLSLRKLGYSPYVIKDQGGKSRLFVGAFLTKEGVEGQHHDLKSNGIHSQVVRR